MERTNAMHPALRPPDELSRGNFEMIVRRLADDLAFGTDVSRFVGGGLEYAQSRPYVPGDPVRSIDWRITARLGRPFVKEYETLKRTTVYLVLDTSASMAVGSTTLTKHDLGVWLTAAIALLAQRRMSPVAIVGAGERETRMEPGLRRSELWRTLDELREARLDESTRLGSALRSLMPRVQRTSVVMVISDLHDPDALDALREVAHRHDCIALHLFDPAERGVRGAGFFRGQEAESGRTFAAHGRVAWPRAGALASELARGGVSYLRLQTDLPFLAPLRQFLAFRPSITGGRG